VAHDADVAVVGAGPAGWATAAALASRGVRVAVLGDTGSGWPNTYGVWRDEVAGLLADAELEAVWPTALVRTASGTHTLSRSYARVDGEALRARLRQEADAGGAVSVAAHAAAVAHDDAGSTLGCADGSWVRARLIVDASGHWPALVARDEPRSPCAAQVAVGWRVALRRPPYPAGSLMLMDFSDQHLDHVERRDDPTFCYAMDYGDGTWFVEETSLARRPGMDAGRLEDRLRRRLAHHGASPAADPHHAEDVAIPLGLPVPASQRVVAIGGAASMVHPATGYLLASTLRAAPRLAAAVAAVLRDRRASPDVAARAGWQAVWPPSARRRQALYRFGLEALLRLDSAQTRGFMDAFFGLPERQWRGYLSATLPPAALAATMAGLFTRVDASVRLRLLATMLAAPGRTLATDLWRAR
jgi:lycopene beta-cyclase